MSTLGLVPAASLAALSFAKACEAWLESRKPYLSPKTYREYKLNIKTLSGFFCELRLTEIDGDLVRAYQRTRRQQCGAFSINHECGLISLFSRKQRSLLKIHWQKLGITGAKTRRTKY